MLCPGATVNDLGESKTNSEAWGPVMSILEIDRLAVPLFVAVSVAVVALCTRCEPKPKLVTLRVRPGTSGWETVADLLGEPPPHPVIQIPQRNNVAATKTRGRRRCEPMNRNLNHDGSKKLWVFLLLGGLGRKTVV